MVLGYLACISDVCVYGVSVPHCDGKCGMAAIVPSPVYTLEEEPSADLITTTTTTTTTTTATSTGQSLNDTSTSKQLDSPTTVNSPATDTSSSLLLFPWTDLEQEIQTHLPTYARPIFLRFMKYIPVTATFKHMKNVLMEQVIIACPMPYLIIENECVCCILVRCIWPK